VDIQYRICIECDGPVRGLEGRIVAEFTCKNCGNGVVAVTVEQPEVADPVEETYYPD
jgi:hypothetical protein